MITIVVIFITLHNYSVLLYLHEKKKKKIPAFPFDLSCLLSQYCISVNKYELEVQMGDSFKNRLFTEETHQKPYT